MSKNEYDWADDFAPEEILSLLQNDTRQEIIQEIYRSFDRHPTRTGISFSELFERVNSPDKGTFNYHLDKLDGEFIKQVDDEYWPVLTWQKALHESLSWLEIEHDQPEPRAMDYNCPLCGEPMKASYSRSRLELRCEASHEGHAPIVWTHVPPRCGVDRSLAELVDMMPIFLHHRINRLLHETCAGCYAKMEPLLGVVREDGRTVIPIEEAESSDGRIGFLFGCSQCNYGTILRLADIALRHPNGQSFLQERGMNPLEDPLAFVLPTAKAPHVDTGSIVSTDPITLETSLTIDGGQRTFTIDENGSVLSIE